MNKTRRQIIEIIKPYMDKTLSEGCLIEDPLYKYIYKYISLKNVITEGGYPEQITIDIKLFNIIGHYDITAVIKYMVDKCGSGDCFIMEDCIDIDITTQYRLPNKPLSLYNTQEEKDLLDFLLKLK